MLNISNAIARGSGSLLVHLSQVYRNMLNCRQDGGVVVHVRTRVPAFVLTRWYTYPRCTVIC
jgi:hypothetical protein